MTDTTPTEYHLQLLDFTRDTLEIAKGLRDRIQALEQQLQQLIMQTAMACATCLHEERAGTRPGHNLANTVIDGTAYCNEHRDHAGGRLVPRKSSGLIITAG